MISPYQVKAVQTAQATSEAIEPLAYEANAAVAACPANTEPGQTPMTAPGPDDEVRDLVVGVFFDGTNNNALSASRGATNIERLFKLHWNRYDAASKTYYAKLYVRGVGSLDEANVDADFERRTKAADEEHERRMASLGTMARLLGDAIYKARQAADSTSAWARQTAAGGRNVLGQAGGLGAADRIAIAYDWIKGQAGKISNKPLGSLTIRAYGFSRGAATARSFWNAYRVWLRKDPALTPLGSQRFDFLGIYDTVASFGAGGGRRSTPGHNITLGPDLSTRFFHACAADEFRGNFRLNPAQATSDVFYPGTHSDVGGGYGAGEQDRSLNLAEITLVDMHDRAGGAAAAFDPVAPAVVARAQRTRSAAAVFERQRVPFWRMAFDLKKDQVYPQVTAGEVVAYARKTGEGQAWINAIWGAVLFFNQHMHVSHFRNLSTSGGKKYPFSSSDRVSNPIDGDLDETTFARTTAEPYPQRAVSGYPEFEWEEIS